MNAGQKKAALALLAVLVAAACVALWFATFEKRWEAIAHYSPAARENPMLAATRLLTGRGFQADSEATLREALLKPAPGLLLVNENRGVMTQRQADQLLAWVREGSVLVLRPDWQARRTGDASAEQPRSGAPPNPSLAGRNPVARRFGVVLAPPQPQSKRSAGTQRRPEGGTEKADAGKPAQHDDNEDHDEDEETERDSRQAESAGAREHGQTEGKPAPAPFASIVLPGLPYALRIDPSGYRLASNREEPKPVLADEQAQTVRVYAEGKGYVVFVARNYFNNEALSGYDHGELLLALARLPQTAPAQARRIVFVQNLDVQKWHQALWQHFYPGLIGAACTLLLALWAGMRRFGPMLPGLEQERSSLLEHIDASGRWLWKVPGGRELLLKAARLATEKALQRRAPELLRLDLVDRIERLAATGATARADLQAALLAPAARMPNEFTRQIQTLRKLRLSYEP